MRAMKDIESGEELTTAFVALCQNKWQRNKALRRKSTKECNCDKCRLNLDKDFDYIEFEAIMTTHMRKWRIMGFPLLNYVVNRNYLLDINLMENLRRIYGPLYPYSSELIVLSFICFTIYSKHSNIILVSLWYQKISKMLAITHGKAHPLYKLVTDLYCAYS